MRGMVHFDAVRLAIRPTWPACSRISSTSAEPTRPPPVPPTSWEICGRARPAPRGTGSGYPSDAPASRRAAPCRRRWHCPSIIWTSWRNVAPGNGNMVLGPLAHGLEVAICSSPTGSATTSRRADVAGRLNDPEGVVHALRRHVPWVASISASASSRPSLNSLLNMPISAKSTGAATVMRLRIGSSG